MKYILSGWILLFSSNLPAGVISLNFGYSTLSLREVATSEGPKALDVSPVSLTGSGYYIGATLETGNTKVHRLSLDLSCTGYFKYKNGLYIIKREGDKQISFTTKYNFDHYLFRNLFTNLDIAIGLQIFFTYLNTIRNFSPETRLSFTEYLASPSFVITLQYGIFPNLMFKTILINGNLFGIERTKHNIYGTMPKKIL